MAVFCSFGQSDFVRWLMSDGFVRQSKRALRLTMKFLNCFALEAFIVIQSVSRTRATTKKCFLKSLLCVSCVGIVP